jgi:hypothetical protein
MAFVRTSNEINAAAVVSINTPITINAAVKSFFRTAFGFIILSPVFIILKIDIIYLAWHLADIFKISPRDRCPFGQTYYMIFS